jgi:type I restriction enzyme S subunit
MINRHSLGDHWPILPLSDVVEFLDHQRRPVTESDRVGGLYPYYGANGPQGTIDDFIFDEPLILLAEDGGHFNDPSRGIAYQIAGKTWVNNHAHVLRPKLTVDLNYLCKVLEHYDVSPFVTGTTRGKLTKAGASGIPIPLPPMEQQRRIAAILDQAEALRTKCRQALAKLDTLTQSLFLEMFGDPWLNPRGWQIKNFGEVGVLDRGVSKHRPRNAPELLGGAHPLIQTGEITNCDGYVRSYRQTYSDLGLKQSKVWPAGTLCITIAANIAKTGILTFPACFPDSIVGFTPDELMTAEYAQTWMSFMQKHLEDNAPSFAQKNINLAILRALPIPVPPIELLQRYSHQLARLENFKRSLVAADTKANDLFASLQHRAFHGEL